MDEKTMEMINEIKRMKKENAVIVAHNYQIDEVQIWLMLSEIHLN